MWLGKRTAAQLRAVALAAFVLRECCAIEAFHFPDGFDVAERFDFVARGAHQLIWFGAPPCVWRRMFADQIFSLIAIVDAALAVLLLQQRFVFARSQIETMHEQRRAFPLA